MELLLEDIAPIVSVVMVMQQYLDRALVVGLKIVMLVWKILLLIGTAPVALEDFM